MTYLLLGLLLLVAEILYFKLATRFNIVDRPNERSSHSSVTIRGGGILFWVAALAYFAFEGWSYPYFFLGLTLVAGISFLDDVLTLANRYRIFIQFASIALMFWQLDLWQGNMLVGMGLLVLGVGILNAYNFMDGINGITGGYSSVVILALMAVNRYHIRFIEDDFLNFVLLGLVVFNLFNFRTKALCFAGDVGSISIAFIIVFLIIKASIIDQNPIYLLFLSVYGIDSVLTIIQRILLKQNIFRAHRLHLFQVMVHQQKMFHLHVSGIYMLVQALVCGLVFFWLDYAFMLQLQIGFVIILLLALVYYIVKKRISS